MKDTQRKPFRRFLFLPAAFLPALLLALPLVGCGKEKEPEPPAYQGPSHPPGRKPPREQPLQAEPAPQAEPATQPDAPPSGN